jgi:hypothetical protein
MGSAAGHGKRKKERERERDDGLEEMKTVQHKQNE